MHPHKTIYHFEMISPHRVFSRKHSAVRHFHPMQFLIGLMLPFSMKKARRLLGRIVEEDSVGISVDVTQWHNYRLEWSLNRSAFWVDETLVLDTPVSPRPPLGLVIWMDNQYAAFTPQGKIKWGLEENLTEASLEVEKIEIRTSE